jgi:hypothetical protein
MNDRVAGGKALTVRGAATAENRKKRANNLIVRNARAFAN